MFFFNSALTLFFYSVSSFYRVIGGLLFIPVEIFEMTFSAVCNMFFFRQLYTSFIASWSCTLVVIVLTIWNCICYLMVHFLLLLGGNFPFNLRIIGKRSYNLWIGCQVLCQLLIYSYCMLCSMLLRFR